MASKLEVVDGAPPRLGGRVTKQGKVGAAGTNLKLEKVSMFEEEPGSSQPTRRTDRKQLERGRRRDRHLATPVKPFRHGKLVQSTSCLLNSHIPVSTFQSAYIHLHIYSFTLLAKQPHNR